MYLYLIQVQLSVLDPRSAVPWGLNSEVTPYMEQAKDAVLLFFCYMFLNSKLLANFTKH